MLDGSLFFPALVAGLLVLITHVPLGRAVLQRGIIFIDLAIAQIAGLGVIIAYTLGWEVHGIKTQLIALSTALIGAFLLGKTEHILKERQEALIGISFVLAATAGLLLLAHNPHGGEHLRELLIGQILWTTWDSLIPLALASLVFLFLYWKVPNLLHRPYFYLIFAIMITFSVQIVGVYLVFSSLIMPAFAVYKAQKHPLIQALLLGIMGYILGLLISLVLDLPTGATIVWSLFLMTALYLIIKKPLLPE
jgi:zinc/manganese transport system permease protein